MVDYETFKNECMRLANDDNFSRFKRNKHITYMLEQTEPLTTAEYFTTVFARTLKEKYPELLSELPWKEISENDRIGSPLLFETPLLNPYVRESSHTTLRYVLNALDVYSTLKARTPSIPNPLYIIEVGGGYGGQFKILADIFKRYGITVNYSIVDLPEVLCLIKRYVADPSLTINGKLDYISTTNLTKRNCDLFLSFFALGEIPKSFQDLYIDFYVSNSKYGYIAWNNKKMNPKLYECRKLDIWEIVPRFDRYVSIVAYPSIENRDDILSPINNSLFETASLEIIKNKALQHLKELSLIVEKSGELLEESIMTKHFNSRLIFNLKQVDLYILSRLCCKILNIGFNAGHSTLLMLLFNPNVRVICFDNCEHSYTWDCFQYLDKEFPDRVSLIKGNTTETLHHHKPEEKYDLVNINASHSHRDMNLDFWNAKAVCKPRAYIIWNDLDFYACYPLWIGFINDKHINPFSLYSDEHLLGQYS